MISIVKDVKWGNEPTNYFNFSYESQRSGTTQQYRITVECQSKMTGGTIFGYPIYLEISLNGSIVASKTLKKASPSSWSESIIYTTPWISVTNKTTGTTPLKIHIYSGGGSTRNASYNYNLAVDLPMSTIKATDANIESISSIIFTRYNKNFTHTLGYKADGQSAWTILFSKKDITNYAWTVPAKLYDLIPNERTIEVTLCCKTYNGDTEIGTTTCKMIATADRNKCSPKISVTAEDVNENTIVLTGDSKKIIRGYSDIEVIVQGEAINGAKVEQITVGMLSNNDYVSTDKNFSPFIHTFNNATSADIVAAVVDSRWRTSEAKISDLSLIDYFIPILKTTIKRKSPTSDEVTVISSGKFFNGTFGRVKNTLKLEARFRLQSETEWVPEKHPYYEMIVTTNGNTYTAETTLKGLDYDKAYTVRVRATDEICKYGGALSGAVYTDLPLKKGIPVFDWGEEDFRFNVKATVKDNEIYHQGNLKIATGIVKIEPNGADSPGNRWVDFPEGLFTNAPIVMVTPETTAPGTAVTGVGVYSVDKDGCTVWLTRKSTTATNAYWFAIEII